MKLATYRHGRSGDRLGLVDPEREIVTDLNAAVMRLTGRRNRYFASMLAMIEGGDAALELARQVTSDPGLCREFGRHFNEIIWRSPLPAPPQFRDCMSYEQHLRDASAGMAELRARITGQKPQSVPFALPPVFLRQPVYYITNRFSVTGPNATVTWPGYSQVIDFELEIAIVVGRRSRNLTAEMASEHIFGYTIFNDLSARDQQMLDMEGGLGPTKGKSFDDGNVLGPWIVTRDEIPDPQRLLVTVRVNDQEWARGSTEAMFFNFEQILAFISRDETLMPGEVIASGTVGGCCGLEIGRFLEKGDQVELSVERIGSLRNRID